MRFRVVRAVTTMVTLSQMPSRPGAPTGSAAMNLSEAEALRIERRQRRWVEGGKPMTLGEVVARSGRRARARQTHPGKR